MNEMYHMCPKYERAATLLGKRWTGLILRVLGQGPMSFSQIAKAIDRISDRVLAERLKELEMRGVVQRRVFPTTPVRVEYSLTRKGSDLQYVLDALQVWAEQWEGDEGSKFDQSSNFHS
jgi:DNA-binding HxlR family transcriptional regulator